MLEISGVAKNINDNSIYNNRANGRFENDNKGSRKTDLVDVLFIVY